MVKKDLQSIMKRLGNVWKIRERNSASPSPRTLLLEVVLPNKSLDDFETDFDFHFEKLKLSG